MKVTDPMPWGTHKNTPVGDVPFDYLLKKYRKGGLEGKNNEPLLKWFEGVLRELEQAETRSALNNKPKKYIIESHEREAANKNRLYK